MDIESKKYPGWGVRITLGTTGGVVLHNCGMTVLSGTNWATRIKRITKEDLKLPGYAYLKEDQWAIPPGSNKEHFLTLGEVYEALDQCNFLNTYRTVRGSIFFSDRVGPDMIDADLDTIVDHRATYKDCGLEPPKGWKFHENGIYLYDEKGCIVSPEGKMSATPRRSFGMADIANYIISRKLGCIFRGPIVENSNHPGQSAICTWIWLPDPEKLLYGKVNKYNVPDELPHLSRTGAYPHLVAAAENFAKNENRFSKLGAKSERKVRTKKVPDVRSA